ncbi:hypothetical protein [Bradyrhizobium sp. CER78]|uniref:hypothetical protein n=1 Tax=Bradyrhizobium sp. CER78 TaxID=3039162 RepID=UPI002449FF64|nr:hypothetical protein [Bradyrhizobium sp. CER78]MDH2385518.1 hypothetical protein [Bradyrhizobium sp. CER78]
MQISKQIVAYRDDGRICRLVAKTGFLVQMPRLENNSIGRTLRVLSLRATVDPLGVDDIQDSLPVLFLNADSLAWEEGHQFTSCRLVAWHIPQSSASARMNIGEPTTPILTTGISLMISMGENH